MSYSEMYAMRPGTIESIGEYPNSWGFAALIWDKLFDKYIPKRFEYDSWMREPERLWKLADSEALPAFERVVLASTFDNVVIRREDLVAVADCFDKFVEAYSFDGRVCHLSAMAEGMRLLDKDPGDAIGVAWHVTSVAEDPWMIFDTEDGDSRCYDISTGNKHWFLDLEFFGYGEGDNA